MPDALVPQMRNLRKVTDKLEIDEVIKVEKTLFTYQRWFLRIGCAGIALPFVLIIQDLVAKLMGIEYANFGYILICGIIMLIWLHIYYKFTQRHKWFERTGVYWIKDGTVYIQKQNKVYELKKVKWLRGTTVSAYGMAKSGMLVIQFDKKKIILVSSQTTSVDSFANCELLHIFETILEYNTELIKDDALDFWYEIKD